MAMFPHYSWQWTCIPSYHWHLCLPPSWCQVQLSSLGCHDSRYTLGDSTSPSLLTKHTNISLTIWSSIIPVCYFSLQATFLERGFPIGPISPSPPHTTFHLTFLYNPCSLISFKSLVIAIVNSRAHSSTLLFSQQHLVLPVIPTVLHHPHWLSWL